MYQQNAFVNICQAIEIYHRSTKENQHKNPDEFNIDKQEVLDAIPEKHYKWINQKLHNEPSAKIRLLRILEEYPFLDEHIGDYSLFVKQVIDTRTFYVHNIDRRYKMDDVYDLHGLIGKLKLVLYSCILSELTFSNGEIYEIINNSRRLLSFKDRKRLFVDKTEEDNNDES